jgi:SAM-dependent methyltransferase
MAGTQKEIWKQEHLTQETFTRIHSDQPSYPLPLFVGFLKEMGEQVGPARILDIGCGKGRNSIWLASQGFDVVGVDFAEEAVSAARDRSGERFGNLHFGVMDLTETWEIGNNSFDAIIDCNCTICIPEPGRTHAIYEAMRVLRPGGYYLFYGVARTPFVDKSPGPEPNSAIFPRTGKFEKQYTEEELTKAYQGFRKVYLGSNEGKDIIEGKEISYSMWVGLFRNF